MRRNRVILLIFIVLSVINIGYLQAQTLQVNLSSAPKVNRSTTAGTVTIFFDSNIDDLSIVCTEEDPNEPIIKINDHQWFVNIDVKQDIEDDGICYRNYLLKCSASAEYFLKTDDIAPNQVLYYSITLPNELEPGFLKTQAKDVCKTALTLIRNGDMELATTLLSEVDKKTRTYYDGECMPEIEYAYRVAYDSLMYGKYTPKTVLRNFYGEMLSASISNDDKLLVTSSTDQTVRFWDLNTGEEYDKMRINRPTSVWAKLSPTSNYLLTNDYEDTLCIFKKQNDAYALLRKVENYGIFCNDINFIDDSEFRIWSGMSRYDVFRKKEYGKEEIWEINTVDSLYDYANFQLSPFGDKILFQILGDSTYTVINADDLSQQTYRMSGEYSDFGSKYCFSPTGKYIIEETSGSIFIHDTADGKLLKSFLYPESYAVELSFGNNGNTLVCNDINYGIRLIDLIELIEIPFSYKNPDDTETWISSLSNSNKVLFVGNNKKKEFHIYQEPFDPKERIVATDTIYEKNNEIFINTNHPQEVHFGSNTRDVKSDGLYCWWKRFRNEWEYNYMYSYENGILTISNAENNASCRLNIPHIGPRWMDGLHAYANNNGGLFATINNSSLEIRDCDDNLKFRLKHNCQLTTASFSKDSKYVVTLTEDNALHIWEIYKKYPFEIYKVKVPNSYYEYATLSENNGFLYVVNYPSRISTERVELEIMKFPSLEEVESTLKLRYGNYCLSDEEKEMYLSTQEDEDYE